MRKSLIAHWGRPGEPLGCYGCNKASAPNVPKFTPSAAHHARMTKPKRAQ